MLDHDDGIASAMTRMQNQFYSIASVMMKMSVKKG